MSAAHRRVALRLYSMCLKDKRWFLGRLTDSDRVLVEGYLAELYELNIDASIFVANDDILNRKIELADASLGHSETGVSDEAIKIVLAGEPNWVVVALSDEFCGEDVAPVCRLTEKSKHALRAAFQRRLNEVGYQNADLRNEGNLSFSFKSFWFMFLKKVGVSCDA